MAVTTINKCNNSYVDGQRIELSASKEVVAAMKKLHVARALSNGRLTVWAPKQFCRTRRATAATRCVEAQLFGFLRWSPALGLGRF